MSNFNRIKSLFGSLIFRDYCEDCGKHNKPKYRYDTPDGDNGFCFKCECGTQWHAQDHMAQ